MHKKSQLQSNNNGRLYDGKCYYDVLHDCVVHDSGPMSDQTCAHPRHFDDTSFRDLHRDQIASEKAKLERVRKGDKVTTLNATVARAIEAGNTITSLGHGTRRYWDFIDIPKGYRASHNLCLLRPDADNINVVKNSFVKASLGTDIVYKYSL